MVMLTGVWAVTGMDGYGSFQSEMSYRSCQSEMNDGSRQSEMSDQRTNG